MILRNLIPSDIEHLKRIHEQYKEEFALGEFNAHEFIGMFTAEENGEIISIGGIRLIPEIVVVTDKTKPVKTRRAALLNILQASGYIVRRAGHSSLHAFVQSESWMKQLIKYGFKKTKGDSLVYSVGEEKKKNG